MRDLYRRKMEPSVIMSGLKVFQMTVRAGKPFSKLIFRDSYLLMLAPLDSLKRTFNLQHASEKPFFPYLWNKRENLYKSLDHLPPAEYYIPESMSPKKFKKFQVILIVEFIENQI